MDGEEKVRILAWRQEHMIMKKSTDYLVYICDNLVGCCS